MNIRPCYGWGIVNFINIALRQEKNKSGLKLGHKTRKVIKMESMTQSYLCSLPLGALLTYKWQEKEWTDCTLEKFHNLKIISNPCIIPWIKKVKPETYRNAFKHNLAAGPSYRLKYLFLFYFLPHIASGHSGFDMGKQMIPYTIHPILFYVYWSLFLGLTTYSLNWMLGQIWPYSISLNLLFCYRGPNSLQLRSWNNEATISAQCPWKSLVPLHSCLQLNEPLFSASPNEVAKSRPSLMVSDLDLKEVVLTMSKISPEEQKQPSLRPLHLGKLCIWATP